MERTPRPVWIYCALTAIRTVWKSCGCIIPFLALYLTLYCMGRLTNTHTRRRKRIVNEKRDTGGVRNDHWNGFSAGVPARCAVTIVVRFVQSIALSMLARFSTPKLAMGIGVAQTVADGDIRHSNGYRSLKRRFYTLKSKRGNRWRNEISSCRRCGGCATRVKDGCG